MSDKEIIIRSLKKVERRLRANRLIRELTFGLSVFLLIPVLFKTWDLVRPFRGSTVLIVFGLWAVVVAGYFIWRMGQKDSLSHAAAAIDHKAALRDEIKSAYWFVTSPQSVQRSTEWVELQVRRAARRANELDVPKLYPRKIPSALYAASGLVVLLVALNFTPFSENHNWVYLQAAPAFTLTPEEMRLINQTKQLLKQAEKLDQPLLVQQLEQIIEELQKGTIDSAEALKQLEDLRNALDEGNLDMANVNEGLDEMAKDLSGNPQTEDVSKAMAEHDLEETAEELRKLAEELNPEDQQAMQALREALQQASENSNPSMQKLANDMKQAADSLGNKNSKAAQDALNQAAKDTQNLQQMMQEQMAKNDAKQQIQSLQDQLRQRQQGQGQEQAQKGQMGQAQEGQQGKAGQEQEAGGEGGQQSGSPGEQAGAGQEGQPGKPGDDAQAGGAGGGQNPSGAKQAPMDIMGAPTKLNVQLEKEKLAGLNDGGTPQDLEEASKQERSKLDYRNIRSELSPAQKDVLNQDKIPWEYKALIKNYFQAIRPQPRGK